MAESGCMISVIVPRRSIAPATIGRGLDCVSHSLESQPCSKCDQCCLCSKIEITLEVEKTSECGHRDFCAFTHSFKEV